ncbi:MAG: hypothetical protein AABY84_08940 [Candidatus Firestonebacteria bacterium]
MNPNSEELRNKYKSLTNVELVRLFQSGELTEDALTILQAELSMRNIIPDNFMDKILADSMEQTVVTKPKFERLIFTMLVLMVIGQGYINVPLGYYVIRKIKRSNGALRGTGLAWFFFIMGCLFLIGLLAYFILRQHK